MYPCLRSVILIRQWVLSRLPAMRSLPSLRSHCVCQDFPNRAMGPFADHQRCDLYRPGLPLGPCGLPGPVCFLKQDVPKAGVLWRGGVGGSSKGVPHGSQRRAE